jgi:hypothetical protein
MYYSEPVLLQNKSKLLGLGHAVFHDQDFAAVTGRF